MVILKIGPDCKFKLIDKDILNRHSPDAVQLLRYFYEESPEIHVIVAGSLLETMINRHISYYLVSQISKIISCQL